MPLTALGTRQLTWRKFLNLVTYLPLDAAYVHGRVGERLAWSPEAYLLADVVDVLQAGNWQRGGGKGPRPKPLHRPGDTRRRHIKGNSYSKAEFDAVYARALAKAAEREASDGDRDS